MSAAVALDELAGHIERLGPLAFLVTTDGSLVQLLPFQSIAYIPVSIYVGEPATGGIGTAVALQAFWAVAMVFVIRFVWQRAVRHTVIQGG